MLGVNALSGGGGIITNPAVVASFLSHFNGTDGSTTITDEYGNACAAQDNAQIDTAQSKFGGASLELDGTGDFVSVTDFADATPGSSDWLFECWVRPDINNAIKNVASKREASTTNGGWFIYIGADGKPVCAAWNAAGSVVVAPVGVTVVTTATWHHIGILKIGTLWGLLLDGVVDATGTESGVSGTAGTEVFRIGRDASNTARDFDGHVDEMRIVKGAEVAGIYPNALTSLTYTVPAGPFEKG